MFIHIGLDKVIRSDDVLGIFDLDNTTVSKVTRDYLSAAQKKGEITDVCTDLPKSFVVCAENGANVIKTYYCEEKFEQVTNACPVPIVIAGGKKLPERDALQLAKNAIDQGAAGVDMGRNIFQADSPVGMLLAVREIVHNGATVDQAFDCYETYKNQAK